MRSVDIIIIGGGLSGSAVAYGLARKNAGKVLLFDEQLSAQRLSRGNFGLTWFMCKGGNNPAYAQWCRMATRAWPNFAAELEEETGYDLELEWNGGAIHAIGEEQFAAHAASIENLKKICAEVGMDYPVRMLNRAEFADLIPGMTIGEQVSGAMFTEDQGHVNPLKLLGAMRCAFQKRGGTYLCGESVTSVSPQKNGTFIIHTSMDQYCCDKVIIAAGHGSAKLLAPLGVKLNIYPQRGQLMVTERQKKVMTFPVLAVRQTKDGSFMVGLSTEDTAHDSRVTVEAMKNQATGALQLFPDLAKVNWTRAWGSVRVMTPDGAPIYSKLEEYPDITVMALHSAVSLAPLKLSAIAPWIMGEGEDKLISSFSNGRFNV
ncbi:NAD(P)/FAD-dependent oxidoreductase [Desulfopila aestuarii]|uniref:Glycine/D-amino acid oxidase n=1 Tax=Desulfopila aestuarii DSM 18488 TaxID=1121416 RepID=A0A1M7XYB4_9BACT|nr:FAD-dependent oxidoreductase [Desulfopila aestuarii]SHO43963.1 Glycine/D-amino acid oxidase [Desulfopila aestuarii DSM 18488]